MRPDIVWWSDHQRELWLFGANYQESHVADAREQKRVKYQDLVVAGKAAGYTTELLTVEVGSRGMLGIRDLEPLATAVSSSCRDVTTLSLSVIRTTLLESYRIWCARNSVT